MAVTTIVDPISRIEGHLKVSLTISDPTDGTVQDVKIAGNMYRGFENFLIGQNPLSGPLVTQRICGVCPIPHALCAVLAIDDATRVQATNNGRLMRNIMNGAEFLHSHILHAYHLSIQDYIDMPSALGGSTLNQGPWAPLFGGDRRITGTDLDTLAGNYITALSMRREAHSALAIIAGKQPHAASIIPGGCSATPSSADVDQMTALITEVRDFVLDTYIPDIDMIFNTYYSDYFSNGVGCGKLLSYGAFRQGTDSTNDMLIKRGIYDGSTVINTMDQNLIVEDISKAWYTGSDGLHPSSGETNPDPSKLDAYSWCKAPRYKTDGTNKDVYELGPLARMVVTGEYPAQISTADRIVARSHEALLVANAILGWLTELGANLSEPSFVPSEVPANSSGVGLTESGRGATGHWVSYDSNSMISRYQVISPTAWNCSPRDADGTMGTLEQALIGMTIQDASQPVEAIRVIHSYDPCLSCAVQLIRDDGKTIRKFIV